MLVGDNCRPPIRTGHTVELQKLTGLSPFYRMLRPERMSAVMFTHYTVFENCRGHPAKTGEFYHYLSGKIIDEPC